VCSTALLTASAYFLSSALLQWVLPLLTESQRDFSSSLMTEVLGKKQDLKMWIWCTTDLGLILVGLSLLTLSEFAASWVHNSYRNIRP
jgi:hypothetical protein